MKNENATDLCGLGAGGWRSLFLTAFVLLDLAVNAAAEVTINGVGMVDPWDGAKGAVTVDYSLAGLEAGIKYKVVFDFTANGRTVSVTNDAATLSYGRQPIQTNDTTRLFGGAAVDKDATVKVSIIAVRRLPGVQLWKDGPFWAECNIGAENPEDYGYIFDFDNTWKATSEPWQTPRSSELESLINADNCECKWDGVRKGWIFTGKGDYSSNSIFLPAAGKGLRREGAGSIGYYWSSSLTPDSDYEGYYLYLDHGTGEIACKHTYTKGLSDAFSVRAVRSASSPSWEDVTEASVAEKFPLGVTEVTLPTGMIGYGYVASNLTVGVEIEADEYGRSVVPLGARVGIYAVPETGYVIAGTNPYVIEYVTLHTAIDADDLPKVPPTVMINEIRSVDTWDGEKGPVTVDYTLAGLDSGTEYKVAFDITANGRTASVTNDAAMLSDGRQTVLSCDTAQLFGEALVADDAEMRISLIALKASGDSAREEIVESVAGTTFLLGMTEIALPTGMVVYHHVVSNLTDAATEIASAGDGRYVLPLGAKVGVYAVSDNGAHIVGTNPYVIEKVASDTLIDEDALPKVPPTVIIRKVETSDPWDGAKGAVTVDYSLAGLEADWWYRVAFDVTANGRTVCVTNEEAKLPEGTQVRKTIETTLLFGEETIDKDAKIKVTLIAVTQTPDGQLWANGPEWAEFNLGESEVEGHPEYGALYDFDSATNAVAKLGDGWRLPTGDEFAKLVDASVCTHEWDDVRKGWIVWGEDARSLNSIFLPAAGIAAQAGGVRQQGGVGGLYISSTVVGSDNAQELMFNKDEIVVSAFFSRAICYSVRAVKDVAEAEVIEKAAAETGFRLGPGGESCPWTVTVGEHPHMSTAWTSGDGSVTNVIEGASFRVSEDAEEVKVIFTADDGWEIVGDAVVELGTVTCDIVFGVESGFHVPTVRHKPVSYIDADGQEQTHSVDVVTEETRVLANGWYAVVDDVDITAKTNIVVRGDVHLILCDGASLTVTNAATRYAALSVGTNDTLTIYGQASGTGRLAAKGGGQAPAIGGSHIGGGCGTVVIHGGTITANAGASAAAIGGCRMNDGGSVTITGGRIVAVANPVAADIGNGYNHMSPCEVSISGGVFARVLQDEWLASGYALVSNLEEATRTEYPWAVENRRIRVTLSVPAGPYTTVVDASNALAAAEFAPSDDVLGVLVDDAAKMRYAGWFGLGVVSKGANEWYVEAALTEAGRSRLVESATEATRQIPVAEIAALTEGARDVRINGCEPGFYYALHGAATLPMRCGLGETALPAGGTAPSTGTVYGPVLCGAEGKVEFKAVEKPSAAAGFFTISLSETN